VADRTLYRIVKRNPPSRRDFLANQARRGDFPFHLPPLLRRLWDGISVHDTAANARRQAVETPWLGSFIAELRLPEPPPAGIRWERTVRNNEGHHTLWGDPETLLGYVTGVVPVQEVVHEHDI
jgi:hypothetical protein